MWSQFHNGPVYLLISHAAKLEAGGRVVVFWVDWVISFEFQEECHMEEPALGFICFDCLGCFRSICGLRGLEGGYLGSASICGVT